LCSAGHDDPLCASIGDASVDAGMSDADAVDAIGSEESDDRSSPR
jgi:hypothetical protein